VIELPVEAKSVLEALSHHGIQGGYDMSVMNDCCNNLMLVCATEIFDDIDLQKYASALESILTSVVQPEVLV
jgi:glycine dehydrogenase subunit 1